MSKNKKNNPAFEEEQDICSCGEESDGECCCEQCSHEDTYQYESPSLGPKYRIHPAHNQNLSDVLRNIAAVNTSVLNETDIVNIIKDVFQTNGLVLVSFADGVKNIDGIIYYTKQTKDGFRLWVTKQSLEISSALADACNELKKLGYSSIVHGDNISVLASSPVRDTHDAYVVASLIGGKVVEIKDYQKSPWYTIELNKKLFSYSYVPNKLTVRCKKSWCDIDSSFPLSDINNRQIANILAYQAKRYEKIFESSSYGLTSMLKPMKHLKHALISCGDRCVIVVTPTDEVYLVNDHGQYNLCKDEGKIGLDIRKSFKTIHNVNFLKFSYGDIYAKFSNLLKRRGYFD